MAEPREALSDLRFARERSQFRQFRLTPDILVSLSSYGWLPASTLTKTTLDDQKDQCSDIYCKTNEWMYEG